MSSERALSFCTVHTHAPRDVGAIDLPAEPWYPPQSTHKLVKDAAAFAPATASALFQGVLAILHTWDEQTDSAGKAFAVAAKASQQPTRSLARTAAVQATSAAVAHRTRVTAEKAKSLCMHIQYSFR